MSTQWNEEQKRAISENGNLIVSAGAGAGKTTVLTERVLRLIKEGTGIEEMLVLTFTRAAASEMKNRIEKKLTEAEHNETDPEKKRYLKRQVLLCPNASISTIDSFCASVVHRHYYRLDLPPAVGTVDETEKAIFLDESIQGAIEAQIAEEPEVYHTLLRAFNGAEALKEAIGKLHLFLEAQPDREQWQADLEKDCESGELTERALREMLIIYRRELKYAIDSYRAARDTLNALGPESEYSKYVQHADEELSRLSGILIWNTAEKYGQALAAMEFKDLPRAKAEEGTEQLKKSFADSRNNIKDIIKSQANLFSGAEESAAANKAENEQVSKITKALLNLLRRTETLFTAVKLEKGKIDFADMEYYALQLLSIEEVAAEYKNRFKTVIEDEYQDSNRLQEAILGKICGPDNAFFVGDVKQSIYGFRKAEPRLFLEKTEKYSTPGENGKCIFLNSNYRSSPEILNAVNSVFTRLMTAETGFIHYDASQQLIPGREQPEGHAELVLLNVPKESDAEAEEDLENPEAEAMFCVEKIRELMEREKEPGVKYTYRDFTVLLRSGGAAADMARIFTEEGIPCFYESKKGYFDSIEVQLFLNLLRLIDNRRQDIPLVSVLRSFVGEYTDAELIRLRKYHPDKDHDILDCLLSAAEAEPEGKAAQFLNKLDSWRRMSLYRPARELCSLLLEQTGLGLEMCMLPGGKQREANLNEVLNLAGVYDDTGAFGLHGFLRFADKAREKDKVGTAPTEAGNAVRFMTVHGSKGLEFPVVFYCNLAKKFNTEDTKKDMLLDSKLGIGLSYTEADFEKHEPRLHKLIKKHMIAGSREEEMRVLYVGMTRAMRHLYMVGSVKELEETLEKLPEEPTGADLTGCDNALKWLLLLTGKANPDLPRHIIDKGIYTHPAAPGTESADETVLPDPVRLTALSKKFARVYPYPSPAGVPNKTSATALSGQEKVYTFGEDPFHEEEPGETALSHGTKIHAILEKLPLDKEPGALIAGLPEALKPRDRAALAWFIKSELFARMRRSPLCRRELSFTAKEESGALPGFERGEEVLVQGVIDCCFTEGEGYVLLDYKTDSLRETTAAERAEVHRAQIELYARVLTRLTGRPVKERYVVFINERTAVRLD